MHRIALAVAKGAGAGNAESKDRSGETAPRSHVFDEAFAPAWDDSILHDAPSPGRGLSGGAWAGRSSAGRPSTTQW